MDARDVWRSRRFARPTAHTRGWTPAIAWRSRRMRACKRWMADWLVSAKTPEALSVTSNSARGRACTHWKRRSASMTLATGQNDSGDRPARQTLRSMRYPAQSCLSANTPTPNVTMTASSATIPAHSGMPPMRKRRTLNGSRRGGGIVGGAPPRAAYSVARHSRVVREGRSKAAKEDHTTAEKDIHRAAEKAAGIEAARARLPPGQAAWHCARFAAPPAVTPLRRWRRCEYSTTIQA